MQNYLLRNFSELAVRRAIIMREEAQLWDILARDLKRKAGRLEDAPSMLLVRSSFPIQAPKIEENREQKLFVRIAEAAQMIGISRTSLYNEINSSRIKVRKVGRRTLVAISDIHDWFNNLPENVSEAETTFNTSKRSV